MSSKFHLTNTENYRFNPNITSERATISCSDQEKTTCMIGLCFKYNMEQEHSIIAKNFEDNRTRFSRHKTENFEQEKHIGENSFSFSCLFVLTQIWHTGEDLDLTKYLEQNLAKIIIKFWKLKLENGPFLAVQL